MVSLVCQCVLAGWEFATGRQRPSFASFASCSSGFLRQKVPKALPQYSTDTETGMYGFTYRLAVSREVVPAVWMNLGTTNVAFEQCG